MTIAVFALYTPSFQPLADVTLPNIRNYCARHGYRLEVFCGDDPKQRKEVGFHKTELVAELLPSVDAVFVIDIDLLITNQAIRLESFLDERHGMFACHDVNGLNSGAYLIRNGEPSLNFLRFVLAAYGSYGVHGEQDAMRDVLRYRTFEHFLKVVPHPAFNSYLYAEYGQTKTHEEGQWQQGDMCLHLPGMTQERRVEIFTSPAIQWAIGE